MSIFDRLAKNLLEGKRNFQIANREFLSNDKLVGSAALSGAGIAAAISALTPSKEEKMRKRLAKLNAAIEAGDGTAQELKQKKAEVKFIEAVLAGKEKKDG